MYCNYCGKVIQEDANVCAYCGRVVAGVPPRLRLMRSRADRKIAGVCAGVAQYFGLDVTLLRVMWVLVAILGFLFGLIAYVICWILMPEEPVMALVVPSGAQVRQV